MHLPWLITYLATQHYLNNFKLAIDAVTALRKNTRARTLLKDNPNSLMASLEEVAHARIRVCISLITLAVNVLSQFHFAGSTYCE